MHYSFATFCPLLIALLVIGVVMYLIKRWDKEKPAMSAWHACMVNSSVEPYRTDFPMGELELHHTLCMSHDELEDEAASYAMFVLYAQIGCVTPETIVLIMHEDIGTFAFKPCYEEGHLIGVELAYYTVIT